MRIALAEKETKLVTESDSQSDVGGKPQRAVQRHRNEEREQCHERNRA